MWDRSNRMSLKIMKRSIPTTFWGSMRKMLFSSLRKLKKHFAKNDKAEANKLFASLVSIRYKEKEHKGVHYGNV